jgi:hypothetical protein
MAGFIGFSSGFAVSWAKAGAAIRHVIAAAAKIVFNILIPRRSPPGGFPTGGQTKRVRNEPRMNVAARSGATFTSPARYFDGSARMATAVSSPHASLVGSVALPLSASGGGRSLAFVRNFPQTDAIRPAISAAAVTSSHEPIASANQRSKRHPAMTNDRNPYAPLAQTPQGRAAQAQADRRRA